MFKNFFVLINIFAILVPMVIFADGMMIAPPNRYIFETDQKAVIFFEDGMETLIISTSFKGDTEDFGWVVPTPSRPEVEKSSKEIFTALKELTEIQEDYPRAAGFGLDLMSEKGANSVYVLEEKKIEYYDIAVLAANDKDALVDWLNKNDYHFPKQYSYILDSYIQNKWFFTAVKITKDVATKNLQQDMWSGSLIPLQFKFLTNRPVYPLKISSVIEEPSVKIKPDYIDGIIGQAIELDKYEEINADYKSLNLNKGSIEMWVKIDQKDNEQANASFINIYDEFRSGTKLYFGVQGGSLKLHLYSDHSNLLFWSSGKNLSFSDKWNYVAVTWEKDKSPKFYLNGRLLPSKETYPNNLVVPEQKLYMPNEKDASDKIYIGRRRNSKPLKNIYIDETAIYSIVKTDDEIFDSYNNGLGERIEKNEDTLFATSFERNLVYKETFFVRTMNYNNTKKINYNKPSQVGIELYIFTKDKEQVLPGFQTKYAAWTDKKVIEDLAFNDNGEPWMEVKEDRYYLTKLSRYMKYSEMDSDLFFRDAEKNSNIIIDTQKSKTIFYVIIALSILFLIILSPILIYQFYKKD